MAEPKKSNSKADKSDKTIVDVSHPGKTAPSSNSKSVIVTNRPIIKDPMVVEEAADQEDNKVNVRTSREATIQPLSAPAPDTDTKDTKPEPEPEAPKPNNQKTVAALAEEAAVKERSETEESEPAKPADEAPKAEDIKVEDKPSLTPGVDKPADKPEQTKPDIGNDKPADPSPKEIEAEAIEDAKHSEEMQKLIDSKKYFLPINSVEKRRSKRIVVIGVLLSLLLLASWVNIALDAGILEMDGIKPVTDFFPN